MKNKRTKTLKTERIEVRCTKGFKQSLIDLSVQRGISLSEYIESICTDKIIDNLKVQSSPKKEKSVSVKTENACPKPDQFDNNYEDEIWRLLQEGKTPTETAKWLNENGYKPQRAKEFTINSTHAIRQRLKKCRDQ